MDTVGTPAMHNVLSKYNLVTCPARHYLKKHPEKFKKSQPIFAGLVELMIFLNCQKPQVAL